MGLRLGAITLDCNDPNKLAEFWAGVMGRTIRPPDSYSDPYTQLIDPSGREPLLLLQKVPERKAGKNRAHIDLWTANLDPEVDRIEALGAARLTEVVVENGIHWVVMADPE